jgi:type III restriction enzyme
LIAPDINRQEDRPYEIPGSGCFAFRELYDSLCILFGLCLKKYGRWAFAEFGDVFQMQQEYEEKMAEAFNHKIEEVTTTNIAEKSET